MRSFRDLHLIVSLADSLIADEALHAHDGGEGEGGEEDLELPTAAAWVTAATPTVVVRCDHRRIIVLLSAPTPLPSVATSFSC